MKCVVEKVVGFIRYVLKIIFNFDLNQNLDFNRYQTRSYNFNSYSTITIIYTISDDRGGLGPTEN